MSTDILTHTEAGVLTIALNRLARKNSITSAMKRAAKEAFGAFVDKRTPDFPKL